MFPLSSSARAGCGSLPPMSSSQRIEAAAFFGTNGGHAYELDASWGAGREGVGGGVERKVWLCREDDPRWAYFDRKSGVIRVADHPYNHPLKGVFRPRDEP